MWIIAASGAALFAGIVSILGKLGVTTTDPDVATAVRTTVVLGLTWLIAGIGGSVATIGALSPTTWVFLVLSGLATGGSWIFFFKALALGDVNKVVPVDKSSTVLASLFAIIIFGETEHLALKLISIAAVLIGTLMMIERKDMPSARNADAAARRGWLAYAVLAAVFAALTAILGKAGIDGVDSNLGTAIRTTVVFIVAWAIVVAGRKTALMRSIEKREGIFLILSGLATGASWLCYYYALQIGVVSVVVQIDKLSLLVSIAFACLVFHERLTCRAAIGLALIVAATGLMTAFA